MALVQGAVKPQHVSAWLVEYRGAQSESGWCWNVPDEHLRPIRDNDGEDETLQWAPVPSRELVSSN